MILIIDISKKDPQLVLKHGRKILGKHTWQGLYQLNETLIDNIDKFLKKQNLSLSDINKVQVKESKESIVSTRIAKAAALGLMIKKS